MTSPIDHSLRNLEQDMPSESQSLSAYLSGASLEQNSPGTITLTIGIERQKTWTIPKKLLAQRSHVFSVLFNEDKIVSKKHLPTITPDAFANFHDYLRSSIYHPNRSIPDYNTVHTHIDACILGAQLGADDYRKAALRSLHDVFSRLSRSNAVRSPLPARTIEYVCERAGAANLLFAACVTDLPAMMKGLRFLCFDALAAHWTSRNVIFFTTRRAYTPGWGFFRSGSLDDAVRCERRPLAPLVPLPPLTWSALFERFPELKQRLMRSGGIEGPARKKLLKNVEEYFLVFGSGSEESDMTDVFEESESDSGGGEVREGSAGQGSSGQRSAGQGTASQGNSDQESSYKEKRKLTIKLRGFGATQEGGEKAEEESSTAQPEEGTESEHVEDIDAKGKAKERITAQPQEDVMSEHVKHVGAENRGEDDKSTESEDRTEEMESLYRT